MTRQANIFIALCLLSAFHTSSIAWAAKKYYPPGFTPPSDNLAKPAPTSQPEPASTQTIIVQPASPPQKQIIIKTVPVVQAKDPLTVLLEEHRYYDALRLVDARLKKTPGNKPLLMMRGRILRDGGNYSQSINQFQELLQASKTKTDKAIAWNGLAWTHLEEAEHYHQIGDIAAYQVSLSHAEQAFRQAFTLMPNLASAWAGAGKCALLLNDVKLSSTYIRKAKRLAPNELDIRLAEAQLLLAQNDPEAALSVLYSIKKVTTHEPDVFLYLAEASLKVHRVDDAIINLKQLLAFQPDHAEGLKLLSHSYELKMMPQDALETLEKAIALNPNDYNSVVSLIKLYDQRHQQTRSQLLLQSLVKEPSGELLYGNILLQRMVAEKDWQESYAFGQHYIPLLLRNPDKTDEDKQKGVNLFAQAVYQCRRDVLDVPHFIQDPAIGEAQAFCLSQLKQQQVTATGAKSLLENRLDLLLLDPMATVTPLAFDPSTPTERLPEILGSAFLSEDSAKYLPKWMTLAKQAPNRLELASFLYTLGDYKDAAALIPTNIKDSKPTEAITLKDKIAQDQQAFQEHLMVLSMLSKRMPDSYWRMAARNALSVGVGQDQLYLVLAKSLKQRKQPKLAAFYNRLALRYTQDPKKKLRLVKSLNKTQQQMSLNAI